MDRGRCAKHELLDEGGFVGGRHSRNGSGQRRRHLHFGQFRADVVLARRAESVLEWLAASADGLKLMAAVNGGGIYAWPFLMRLTPSSAPSTNWIAVAASANGRNLVATDCCGGCIFSSTKSGVA